MKTAKKTLDEALSYMNCEGIIGEGTRLERVVLYAMEEYSSNLWTSPCICPPDEKTGETLCCNICGRPTARTSEELLGDDDAGVIAVNVASNVIPKLTTQEEAFFIAGFQECVKYLRTSPLLASKDARIRELEEENNRLNKANEFLENCRSQWAEMAIKLKATPQPKIQMLTACGMFEINPMFTSATLCKNCGKEKALHVTPPKN